MPASPPPAAPPPSTGPAIAPTPTQAYNPGEAARAGSGHAPLPGLTAALQAFADGKPVPAPASPAAVQPPPQPGAPIVEPPVAPPREAKPPPQVGEQPKRFVPKDEAPEPPKQPTNEPAPDPAAKQEKSGPAQLRDAYEKLKADFAATSAERETTKKERDEYRSKLSTLEDRIKSLEPVESRAKELEQQLVAADEKLRIADYLNHPEFHDTYRKPLSEAMKAAEQLMSELVAEPDTNPRQATMQDFAVVLTAPNHNEALKRAKEVFGDDMAQTILGHYREIKRLDRNLTAAQKDAASKSLDWAKQRAASEAQQRTQARAQFDQATKDLASKYPQLYLPKDNDADELAARRSGEEAAALVILGSDQPVPDYLNQVAKVYHRAAAHPLLAHRLEKAMGEIESLRSKLAAYEGSTPSTDGRKSSAGDSGGVVVTDPRAQMRAALEKFAQQSR